VTLPLGSSHLPPGHVQESSDSERSATAQSATAFVEEALRWLPDGSPSADAAAGHGSDRPATLAPNSQDAASLGKRQRILVADDNADMRQYLVRLLSDQYDVEAVRDGQSALEAVRLRPPDLIVSDVMMPHVDGFELLRKLRSDARMANLPIILLSARAGQESELEGMDAGADDYLVKPFSAADLLARVSAHLRMAQLREQVARSLRVSEQRLRHLAEAGARIGAALDIPSITGVINAEAAALIGVHQAVSSFTTNANWEQSINVVYLSDKYAAWKEYQQQPDGSGIYSLVCRLNKPMRLTQAELEQHPAYRAFGEHAANHPPMRGWLAAPLVGRDGHNIGLIQLSDKLEGDFTAEDEAILVQLTQIASVAIENAHLVQNLREEDRRKDEFLATLAHELRNPLAPIRSGLQVLRMATADPAMAGEVHSMMERQVTQLVHLVDDLLDLSRISRGKIELRRQRVELASVVQQAIETSRPLIEANRHRLSVTLPPRPIAVEADTTRLAQVFSNLLNNAAKYTEPGGSIHLTIDQQDDQAVVTVRDSGIGISRDMLPKLFQMFTQFEPSREQSQGGLGIGLSLVKKLVEMHGGSVQAESEGVGMGSQFVVQLPVAAADNDAPAIVQPAVQPSASPRRRVLVVDDNRDAATSLAMMLQIMGHDAQTAFDGLQALEIAAEHQPELVLLDIGMPGLNGYETALRIRQQPWGREAVIAALTGWGQDTDRRKSQEAGFDHHMTKPLAPEALKQLLSGLVRQSQ
jgi:signal transduction histidine kinase